MALAELLRWIQPPRSPKSSREVTWLQVTLTTLEKDEVLAEVPFIEGTPLEVRYKADSEGAALRVLPRKVFLEELSTDPLFAGPSQSDRCNRCCGYHELARPRPSADEGWCLVCCAGAVFKNMALTLAIKCEELCWALEEMATEASSVSWRASWRLQHQAWHTSGTRGCGRVRVSEGGGRVKRGPTRGARSRSQERRQEYAVTPEMGRKLQALLNVPESAELQHSTTAIFDHKNMRMHGNLLIFSDSICFYARVFGMTVKKVLPIDSIMSVLRDTPATQEMDSAIEVACVEEALIFSQIPDLQVTAEAINEILEISKRKRRGSMRQVPCAAGAHIGRISARARRDLAGARADAGCARGCARLDRVAREDGRGVRPAIRALGRGVA